MFFKYLRIIVFISLLDSCLAFSQVADVDSILYKSIINQNKINYILILESNKMGILTFLVPKVSVYPI